MVELKVENPIASKLPLLIGAVALEALDVGVLTTLVPFGNASALSGALETAHGLGLPGPGKSSGKEGARCLWFGHAEFLLVGPTPAQDLAQHGAVVDQSDAWCAVSISGEASEQVLARLVPVDLRRASFKRGASIRTQLQHIGVSITRTGPDRFMILAFRSMAGTLVHDLKTAMEGLAARG